MMKRMLISFTLLISILVSLVTIRSLLAPAEGAQPHLSIPIENVLAAETINAKLVPTHRFGENLKERIILIGEEHFNREMPNYFLDVLNRLPDRPLVVLLELPNELNPAIEMYRHDGNADKLNNAWPDTALPYQHIIHSLRRMKRRIVHVGAIDQNRSEVILRRAILSDSRNETMARAIAAAYHRYPKATIVFYGGALHTLLAGRYRYDVANREPAGSRLRSLGIPRSEVTTIILSGTALFPLSEIWKSTGALRTIDEVAKVPFPYFLHSPIFGVQTSAELFDWFVHLGPITPRYDVH